MNSSYSVLILWSSVLSCGHTLPIRYPSFVHQFPMRCTSGSSGSQIRVHQTSTELQQTWTDKYRTPNARGTYKTHVYRTTSWDLFCSTSVPSFVHAQNLPPDWSNLTWRGTHFTACHQTTSIQATYGDWYVHQRLKIGVYVSRPLMLSGKQFLDQGCPTLHVLLYGQAFLLTDLQDPMIMGKCNLPQDIVLRYYWCTVVNKARIFTES